MRRDGDLHRPHVLHVRAGKVALLLGSLVDAQDPPDLIGGLLIPIFEAQGLQGPLAHHQDVPRQQINVLLTLLAVGVERTVLEPIGAAHSFCCGEKGSEE